MKDIIHLIPIAAAGVIAAALIWERVVALFFKLSIDSKDFMGKIEGLLSKGNLQGALDLCASNEHKPLPKVVKAGLMKAARDEAEIKTALEVSILDSSGQINQRIGYLAMLANVATLLGLLGTIAGLIASFKAVASADAATKQSLLAEGISISMNATALGLLVAIPAMIAFSILNGRANKLMDELEKGAGRTLAMLHGRLYSDSEDDFSKLSFEEVPEEKKPTPIKGAA
ncbi:MAG: MotA/TolQ/ExbB proton channel family protein [Bdellovibrionota bacterium]